MDHVGARAGSRYGCALRWGLCYGCHVAAAGGRGLIWYFLGLLLMTPWRNGSASDSRPEGCAFKSRRGQLPFSWFPPNHGWEEGGLLRVHRACPPRAHHHLCATSFCRGQRCMAWSIAPGGNLQARAPQCLFLRQCASPLPYGFIDPSYSPLLWRVGNRSLTLLCKCTCVVTRS